MITWPCNAHFAVDADSYWGVFAWCTIPNNHFATFLVWSLLMLGIWLLPTKLKENICHSVVRWADEWSVWRKLWNLSKHCNWEPSVATLSIQWLRTHLLLCFLNADGGTGCQYGSKSTYAYWKTHKFPCVYHINTRINQIDRIDSLKGWGTAHEINQIQSVQMYKLVSSYCCGDLVIQQNVEHATALEQVNEMQLWIGKISDRTFEVYNTYYMLCAMCGMTVDKASERSSYIDECSSAHIPTRIEFLYRWHWK